MKIIGKILGVIIIFGILGTIYAYYMMEKASEVFVDNPTNKEIIVKIDDNKDLKIAPFSTEKVKLEDGKHKVSLDGKEIGEFEKEAWVKNSFLNPTKGTYIIAVTSYEYVPNSTPDSVIPKGKTEYYGTEIEGPFEVSNDLYLNYNPDYLLEEKFPEELTTYSRKRRSSKKYELKTKIYRIEDYILENFEVTKEELEKHKKEFMTENGEGTGVTEAPTTLETPTTQTGATK